jgi:hypothetical protein
VIDPAQNSINRNALKAAIAKGECVAFIGAGVSAPDYPLWPRLIDELCSDFKLSETELKNCDSMQRAEVIQNKDPQKYYAKLKDIFDRKKTINSEYRYHLLKRIGFYSYYTTNFDPLMIDVFSLHENVAYSCYPGINCADHKQNGLYYLHGRIDPDRPTDPISIVLANSEYQRAYATASLLPGFVLHMFTRYSVCFVGCSFADENMRELLRICREVKTSLHDLNSNSAPGWYAILPASEDFPTTLQTECGIIPVEFEIGDSNYTGLVKLLEELAGVKQPERMGPTPPRRNLLGTNAEAQTP